MFDHLSYLLENSSVGLGRLQCLLFLLLLCHPLWFYSVHMQWVLLEEEEADRLLKAVWVFSLLQLEMCQRAAGVGQ